MEKMKVFYEELLNWYSQNRRVLPWREDPSPYHVWLSEIMLQQTRVEAVKEYYRRFLDNLPDVASLAEAPEELCLKLWEGLGYYSRVRNLKKAAVEVMENRGGEIPNTCAELKKLPGIGTYTSAAMPLPTVIWLTISVCLTVVPRPWSAGSSTTASMPHASTPRARAKWTSKAARRVAQQ